MHRHSARRSPTPTTRAGSPRRSPRCAPAATTTRLEKPSGAGAAPRRRQSCLSSPGDRRGETSRPPRPRAVPAVRDRELTVGDTTAPARAPLCIAMDERDNVAIVANEGGLPAGTVFPSGLVLVDKVPQGHKVALVDLKAGDPVRRYNVV